MDNSQIISSYSNDDGLEDGFFADVTPDSMRKDGWRWIVTAGVHEHGFSAAAYAELFNVMATAYNASQDTGPVVSSMNGVTLWLFLEGDEKGGKVFKVILPEEY